MKHLARITLVVLSFMLTAAGAFAQDATASIAGVVKDASGAVLPGVTVEASSPALIEKTRAVVSDGRGVYRIVDLRPGTYAVTFTLAGFNTVKREGIELQGSFAATVNGDMKVGAVSETITVTGEVPVVDVQSTRQQRVVSSEVLSGIPTSRTYKQIAQLVPAVNNDKTQDVGGASAEVKEPKMTVHGSFHRDTRVLIDGMSVGIPGEGVTQFVPNTGAAQEMTYTVSGGMGEAETGGLITNIIPKDGGNAFHGTLFGTAANSSLQSKNVDQSLIDQGLPSTNSLEKVWDVMGSAGGPLKKDKLWFFSSIRSFGVNANIAGMYYNKNAGDVTKWTYVPDPNRQALDDRHWLTGSTRLTYQASPRQKFTVFWDEQRRAWFENGGGDVATSPEAATLTYAGPLRVRQTTYTAPLTNRILVEAGLGDQQARTGTTIRPDYNPALIPVTEQAGAIPGLLYRNYTTSTALGETTTWRASVSYVTGAHHAKFGYYGEYLPERFGNWTPQSLAFRFNNGVPNQLTMSLDPLFRAQNGHGASFYGQDQWTLKRLTLQGGFRYQRYSQTFPDQQIDPTRWLAGTLVFPASEGANLSALTPRMAAVYDVFGDGKTAIKTTLAKYVQSVGSAFGNMNPTARITTSANRTWNDANKNFVPDCVLTNPVANGECAALSNLNFGTTTLSGNTFDPALTNGFNSTPYDWDFDLGVQHQVGSRASLSVTYFRRWFGNFIITDNLATAASDYTFFNAPIPVDSRLPNGGGGTLTFADVNPNKFGQTSNLVTLASNYGEMFDHWNGVDVDFTYRPKGGLYFQGGTSTGRRYFNDCAVQQALPEADQIFTVLNNGSAIGGKSPLSFCNQTTNWLTTFKFLTTYTVPKVDVQFGATLQSIPLQTTYAIWNASSAVLTPALGRAVSGGGTSALNIIQPGTVYPDRLNQLDIKLAKVLKFSGTKTLVGVDLYNVTNSNTVQTFNNTFSPTGTFHTPTFILSPRFLKFSATFDF